MTQSLPLGWTGRGYDFDPYMIPSSGEEILLKDFSILKMCQANGILQDQMFFRFQTKREKQRWKLILEWEPKSVVLGIGWDFYKPDAKGSRVVCKERFEGRDYRTFGVSPRTHEWHEITKLDVTLSR